MEYRTLGKTGLRVSALSFGASSLGGVFKPVDESVAIRTVHTALESGINFIDVSPFYGYTKAEEVLGKALKGVPRDRYFLATKVGRYGDAEFDFSAKRSAASIDESLQRLGIDYVDIIQSHDNEYGVLNQVVNETIPALRQIQKQGKARFVGITGYPLKIFDTILSSTEVDTILSYNHYSLNDTTLAGLLPWLREKGVGIINASPVSQGLLTNHELPAWHPAPEDVRKACADAAAYCRSQGTDIAKLAMQFSLSKPEIHTTLVGTADPANIVKNVKWIEEPIDKVLLGNVQRILATIKDRGWVLGRPENN
ncbi:MAG: aldo/keto reductase [Acidobacteria bacterium]|nr:MAG: aldo/keto reductase [Acidobacteriota bacterium]